MQAARSPAGSGIPSANAPGVLAVTDGTAFAGSIVAADGSFFAFDSDGILLGEFDTRRAAVRVIPKTTSDADAVAPSDRSKRGTPAMQAKLGRRTGTSTGRVPAQDLLAPVLCRCDGEVS